MTSKGGKATGRGDLTTQPVGQLVRRLAIPASVGFLFNTLYNVVDTFWAGRFSTDALAALALSFPIFFLMLAMGMGFSTGATALIGHALGTGDRQAAARTASQGVILSLCVATMVMVVGYTTVPTLFRWLGASDQYLQICLDYMFVILAGTPIIMQTHMVNGVLNAQGDTASFRNYLIVATVANIILDPWFLYGGWGLPALGIKGIAAATILVQIGGLGYLVVKARATGLLDRARRCALSAGLASDPRDCRARGPGQSEHDDRGTGDLRDHVFPQQLWPGDGGCLRSRHADRATGAVARAGAEHGSAGVGRSERRRRRFDRVRQTVQTALLYGAVITSAGAVALFFGGHLLMSLFTDDPAVVATGAHYLRYAAFIEYAYVLLFVNTSVLQGLKRPIFALYIGLYRQILAPVAFFYLATRVWRLDVDGIWVGVLCITWSAALVAVLFALRIVARLSES